ncbi:hypothetical protein ACFL4O_03070, partial [bacterium]
TIINVDIAQDIIYSTNIVNGEIADADINDVAWGKITSIPADLADGDDTGLDSQNVVYSTHIVDGQVSSADIANNTISDSKIVSASNWNTAYSWGDHSLQNYLTYYTETDPLYSAAPASGITDAGSGSVIASTERAKLNYALTYYTETDPIYSVSASTQVTQVKITNWDNTYSWGDHSVAGYISDAQNIIYSTHVLDGEIASADIADWTIINVDIAQDIIYSTNIVNGEIVDADVNSSAAISASKLGAGTVDNTEFGYLDGVSSSIQNQFTAKASTSNPTFSGTITADEINVSTINASNAAGLYLVDDSNNGIFIEDGGQVGIGIINPSSQLEVNGDVEIGSSNAIYLGDPGTDGSWRIYISGNNLELEKRESSSWVSKGTLMP